MKNLMQNAGIQGFFANHSACRTGETCLFRAGVEWKLVKEKTGHSSDAVGKYQITSHEQEQMMSVVLADQHLKPLSDLGSFEIKKKVEEDAKVK